MLTGPVRRLLALQHLSPFRALVGGTSSQLAGDASFQQASGHPMFGALPNGVNLPSAFLHTGSKDDAAKEPQTHVPCPSLTASTRCAMPHLPLAMQPCFMPTISVAAAAPRLASVVSTSLPAKPRRAAAAPAFGSPLGLGGAGLALRRPTMGLFSTSVPVGGHGQVQSSRGYVTEGELLASTFLLTTDIMFWSGLIGAVVFRRNLIVMLLATELVMLACNLNFLFAAAYLNDMTGVIMSLTITTIAACETAIGLALCVTYFHIRSTTDVEALNLLK